jgi:hypothetical protein
MLVGPPAWFLRQGFIQGGLLLAPRESTQFVNVHFTAFNGSDCGRFWKGESIVTLWSWCLMPRAYGVIYQIILPCENKLGPWLRGFVRQLVTVSTFDNSGNKRQWQYVC